MRQADRGDAGCGFLPDASTTPGSCARRVDVAQLGLRYFCKLQNAGCRGFVRRKSKEHGVSQRLGCQNASTRGKLARTAKRRDSKVLYLTLDLVAAMVRIYKRETTPRGLVYTRLCQSVAARRSLPTNRSRHSKSDRPPRRAATP